MIKKVKTKDLYDCKTVYLNELFDKAEYPWEMLPKLRHYILNLIEKGVKGFTKYAEGIYVGKEPPAIIGDGTEIRPGAFIRGNVITGKNCVIGNSTEIKNSILLDNVQVPHYNYVGDSVLGNFAHMGAGSICSNLKSDGKTVVIHSDKDYQTKLRKIGGILGDYADVGCGCVLNPGTVIGKKTSVYPLVSLRGVYPSDCIIKSVNNIVKRK